MLGGDQQRTFNFCCNFSKKFVHKFIENDMHFIKQFMF